MFVNEDILEEKSVRIFEIDPYFSEHYKEKIQTDENGNKYILFRTDIYFAKYFLAVEILNLNKKDKRHQKKSLTVHLLELILVKKNMMQTIKLVKYKRLLVNLKTMK